MQTNGSTAYTTFDSEHGINGEDTHAGKICKQVNNLLSSLPFDPPLPLPAKNLENHKNLFSDPIFIDHGPSSPCSFPAYQPIASNFEVCSLQKHFNCDPHRGDAHPGKHRLVLADLIDDHTQHTTHRDDQQCQTQSHKLRQHTSTYNHMFDSHISEVTDWLPHVPRPAATNGSLALLALPDMPGPPPLMHKKKGT